MTADADRLVDELVAAARELEHAANARDAQRLVAASEAREKIFLALRAAVAAPAPESLRARLREIREIDARVLGRVPALRDVIREERALLGAARDAARSVRAKDQPRFLDVRA